MGDVYRTDDLKLGQAVALKFLPESLALDPDRLERLFAEVRLARQVSHRNVCRVYDIVEHGSEAAVRAKGLLRVEGKEYVVHDGDVIHFRFNV